ncbi:PTS lactose/cellobiose transporter subunit IIA [Peribacillus phoenicis]
MIHAQDHLMNAILVKELLNNLILMQKDINALKEKLEGNDNG